MDNLKKTFIPITEQVENYAKVVLDAAFKVHTSLGPGLLESVYETCLAHEIRKQGMLVETQVAIPVVKFALSSPASDLFETYRFTAWSPDQF